MSGYWTNNPITEILFVMFVNDAKLIESSVLKEFEEYWYQNNHEILIDEISVNDVISYVKYVTDWHRLEYDIVNQEYINNYNDFNA